MAEETNINKQEVLENLSKAMDSYEKEIFTALSDVLYKNFNEEYVREYLKNEHDRIMLSIRLLLNDVDMKANEKALEVTQTIYEIFNTVLNQCNDKIKETYRIQSEKEEDKSQKSEVTEKTPTEKLEKTKTKIQKDYVGSIKKFANFFSKGSVANTMIGIFADNIVFENRPFIENNSDIINKSELKISNENTEQNKTESDNKPSDENKSEIEKLIPESEEKTQPSVKVETEKEDINIKKAKAINKLTEQRISWLKTLSGTFNTAFKTYGKLFTLSILGIIKNSLMESGGIFAIAFGIAQIVMGAIKKIKSFWNWFKRTPIGRRVDDWLKKSLAKHKEAFLRKWQPIADVIKRKFVRLREYLRIFFKKIIPNIFTKLKNSFLNSKFITWLRDSKGFSAIKSGFTWVGKWTLRILKWILTPFRWMINLVKSIFGVARSAMNIMSAVKKAGGIKGVLTKIINKTGIISRLMKGLKTFGGIIMKVGGRLLSFIGGFMDLIEAWKRFQVGDWLGGFVKAVLGILQFFPGAGIAAGIVSGVLNVVEMSAIKIFKALPVYEKDKAKIDTFIGGDFFNYTKAIGYAVDKLFNNEDEEVKNGIKSKYSEITIKNLGNSEALEEAKDIQKNNVNEIIFNSVKSEESQNYNFEEHKSFEFIKPTSIVVSDSLTSLKLPNEMNNTISVLQNRANILPNKIVLAQ